MTAALPFAAETARCRAAQLTWRDRPIRDRLAPIREFRHLLVEHTDRLTQAVFTDVFRDHGEVLATDILPVAAAMQFLLGHAESILKPTKVSRPPLWLMGCRDQIHHRPHGLVGIIGTWNYPIYLNAIPITHALVAGNGVLWKPSEQSSHSASVLLDLFAKAGFSSDLLIGLPATREVGPQLAEADIDFLQFTGSDGVGRQLAKRLGERLIPSILELSGVDACVVLADADIAFAAKAVWFGLSLNAGQTCLAVRRVYVAKEIYTAFVEALKPFVESAKSVKLVLPSQVTALAEMTTEAEAKGCRVLRSSQGSPTPTIVLDAPADLKLHSAACFTPIASVRPINSIDDFVASHEAGEFGLSCSIFTSNPAIAESVAGKLRVGSVIVNDVIVPTAHPATPFGGRRASGWGVTQGADGLLAMTAPQVVTVRSGKFRPHFDREKDMTPMVRALLEATHGRTAWGRAKAMLRTAIAMMKS